MFGCGVSHLEAGVGMGWIYLDPEKGSCAEVPEVH